MGKTFWHLFDKFIHNSKSIPSQHNSVHIYMYNKHSWFCRHIIGKTFLNTFWESARARKGEKRVALLTSTPSTNNTPAPSPLNSTGTPGPLFTSALARWLDKILYLRREYSHLWNYLRTFRFQRLLQYYFFFAHLFAHHSQYFKNTTCESQVATSNYSINANTIIRADKQ